MAVGYCETVQSAEECTAWQLLIMSGICIVGSPEPDGEAGLWGISEFRISAYWIQVVMLIISEYVPCHRERIYDLLCGDGRCLFDDSSIDSFSDRSNPLQDSIGYLYRVQFSAVDRINFIQTKRI